MIDKIWNDEPWMRNINPDLLYRLWVMKGSPDAFLYHTKYDIDIKYIAMPGIGIMRIGLKEYKWRQIDKILMSYLKHQNPSSS